MVLDPWCPVLIDKRMLDTDHHSGLAVEIKEGLAVQRAWEIEARDALLRAFSGIETTDSEGAKLKKEALSAIPAFLEVALLIGDGFSRCSALVDALTANSEFEALDVDAWCFSYYWTWAQPHLDRSVPLFVMIEHCWWDLRDGELSLYEHDGCDGRHCDPIKWGQSIYHNPLVEHAYDYDPYYDEDRRDSLGEKGRALLQEMNRGAGV